MKVVRLSGVIALGFLILFLPACGDTYRPVANPVTPTQPNPAFSHVAVVLTVNGITNPGASTTVDVSGDTAISQATVGLRPVHAALLLNASRLYVANSVDNTVSVFASATPTPVITISLPQQVISNVAITSATQSGASTTYTYTAVSGSPLLVGMKVTITGMQIVADNGVFAITAVGTGTFTVANSFGVSAASQTASGVVASMPTFIASTETASVYVVSEVGDNSSGSVFAISTTSNAITNTISSGGVNPVSMAEIPNGQKLYVANQGSAATAGSVTSINTVDKSINLQIPNPWISPIWVVSRSDGQRVYVLDQGAGTVTAIDTSSDAVVGNVSVGVGADFMLYDPKLNRVYVTNPLANTMTSLDASTDALTATPVSVANAVSVAALPDGTRVYVASAAVSGSTVTGSVTVLNAPNLSVKTTVPLAAAPMASACASKTFYELPMAAAADSTRVYVGNCDAGNTTIITTATDTALLTMPAPLSAMPPSSPGGTPPPQNPVFLLTGP